MWYVLSISIIVLGGLGALPSERNLYGEKLEEGIYIRPNGRDTYEITYHSKRISVYAERLFAKNKKPIVVENPREGLKNYLPPHQNESLNPAEYEHITDLIVLYLKKQGYEVEFT
jgi:hypothetical protein